MQHFQGQTATGAFYTIEAPDQWQPSDGLVIYNHGFDIDQVAPDPDLGVLSRFVQEQGFAIAASSYSLNGWALFQTVDDNRQLYQAVLEHLGEPTQVIVFGGSLGALVTMQAVERGGIGNVVGAYPVCGPLHGGEIWHQALDLRLVYDTVCRGVSGGELPGGAQGLPFALDPDQYDGVLGDITAGLVGAAIARCTGIALPRALRSSGQQQRLSKILDVSRMSEAFFPINMAYATFVLSDLVRDPRKLDERAALGNIGVDYGDAEINAAIERITTDPFDRLQLKLNYTPTGRVGNTRVLATYTDKDGLVVVEHLDSYRRRVPADRFTGAVVVEDEASHCGYSEAEVVAGWESLLEWIATDVRPDASSIQQRCLNIAAGARYLGPCRYDPSFQTPPLDQRVRPRPQSGFEVDTGISGTWFNFDSRGQGWFIQLLENGRAVVYWFTYDSNGAPLWLGGVGEQLDDALVFDALFTTGGASFGEQFRAEDVALHDWGSLRFLFDEDNSGRLRYQGPTTYGSGEIAIERLTQIGHRDCVTSGVNPDYSGLWYFGPERNGEGFIVEVQNDGRVFVAWFTYDPNGRQTWLYGEATERTANAFTVSLERFHGPRFGPQFDPDALQRERWGTVTFDFQNADNGIIHYVADVPGFGSGDRPLIRLSRPLSASRCPNAF